MKHICKPLSHLPCAQMPDSKFLVTRYRVSSDTLTPSILGHILTLKFEYDKTVLLTLGSVCGGQKINGHSLHYLNLFSTGAHTYFEI
ncbi:hypothetical protein E2C01_092782 [Portunus trituberculatus]|uniref:Uncharacterized protein n=1 Tax=Portunus trituberculatus TaxID=210409 RepID=A0A5B7JSC2_PORTR|nr:hypothetical protein [Portunus trituberculatus]